MTNPGNTPLSDVAITDDRCGPVEPVPVGRGNVGDDDGDGLLDPGETWTFTCTQPVRGASDGRRRRPATSSTPPRLGQPDPAGTQVTAAATDDVDVFTPRITLTKTA